MEIHSLDPEAGSPPAEVAQHFQGRARLQSLSSPFADGPAVFAVHFEAGGRTRPHVHRDGQVLIVTDGEGLIGAPDGSRRQVRAGDIVVVAAGDWHWHGGTRHSSMTHVTVQHTGEGSIDWDVDERDWVEDY